MTTLTATRTKPMAPAMNLRAPGRKGTSLTARISRRLMRRPKRTLLIGLGLAMACAIVLNALVFQKARHPSPFLGAPRAGEVKSLASKTTPEPRNTETAPALTQAVVPPARPTNLEALIRETATLKPASSGISQTVAVPRVAARETAPRDPIAELIMKGDVRPPAEVGSNDGRRTVLATQKALAKLGYGAAKTEGRLDDATRTALERFEKDRRLPVTRELSPRTLRELASASGLKID
jgi:hypothetical protein